MLWSSGWVNLTTPPGVKTTGLHGIGLTVTHTNVYTLITVYYITLPQDTKEEYKNLVDAFGVVEQKKP